MRLNVSRFAIAILYGIQSIHFAAFARNPESLVKVQAMEHVVEDWGQSKTFGDLLNKINWDKAQKEELRKAFVKDGLVQQKLPLIEHSRENDIVWLKWGEKTAKVLLVSLDPVVIYTDYQGFEFGRSMSVVDFYLKAKKQLKIENRKTVFLDESYIQKLFLPQAEAKSKDGHNWAWLGPCLGLIVAGIGSFAYLNYKEGADAEKTPASSAEIPPLPAQSSNPPVLIAPAKVEPKPAAQKIDPVAKSMDDSLNKVGEIEKLIHEVQSENRFFVRQYDCTGLNNTFLTIEVEGSEPRKRHKLYSDRPKVGITQREGSKPCVYEFDDKNGVKVIEGKKNCSTEKADVPWFSQNNNSKDLMVKVSKCCDDVQCKEPLQKLLQAEVEKHGGTVAADNSAEKQNQ